MNYYRITRDMNRLEPVTRDGYTGNYDYYYIFKENVAEIDSCVIIKEFAISNTVLLKSTKANN